MSSGYALRCISGPQAGTWYTRRGTVLKFTRVKAAALAGKLNESGTDLWLATKYRPTSSPPPAPPSRPSS